MKIKKEHYEHLERLILLHHSVGLHQKYIANGLSDMRYRWDLLHRSGFNINILYHAGLNDGHIDTALRSITNIK